MKNKSHQTQIKNLQVELLVADSQADKGDSTQKLLKSKLNIPCTRLIQTYELTKFEKEKEDLNIELID